MKTSGRWPLDQSQRLFLPDLIHNHKYSGPAYLNCADTCAVVVVAVIAVVVVAVAVVVVAVVAVAVVVVDAITVNKTTYRTSQKWS